MKVNQTIIKVTKNRSNPADFKISPIKLTSYKPDIEAIKRDAYTGYRPDKKSILLSK